VSYSERKSEKKINNKECGGLAVGVGNIFVFELGAKKIWHLFWLFIVFLP
jgi:hypothetical protein